jgi:hypothetical protein
VALDADVVGRGREGGCDLVQSGQGTGMDDRRAAVVEAGFAERDDQAVAANAHRDDVFGDLVGEHSGEFLLKFGEV